MIVINSPADFKKALASLGVRTNALSKIMKHLGDDRSRDNRRAPVEETPLSSSRLS
jgi:hypothetical protein